MSDTNAVPYCGGCRFGPDASIIPCLKHTPIIVAYDELPGENAPSSVTCERCGGRGGEGSGERNPGTDVWLICQACHGSAVTPTEKAGER